MEAKDIGAVIKRLKRIPSAWKRRCFRRHRVFRALVASTPGGSSEALLPTCPRIPIPPIPHRSCCTLELARRVIMSQTVRGRVIGNHINGNTGSSTLRFVLASFLMSSLDLHPRTKGTKIGLDDGDNQRLRDWQYDNLRLTWCERDQPWEVEHSVIEAMKPAQLGRKQFAPVLRDSQGKACSVPCRRIMR